MKNSFSISVKKPCSEQFENSSKTIKVGFCATCNEEVINFTTLSDEKLIQHFDMTSNKTCGLFKKSQLKTYHTGSLTQISTNLFSKSIGVLSFSLLALCAPDLNAQETASLNAPVQTELSAIPELESGVISIEGKYTVTGTVLDEENLPLAGVNVVLKGTTEGVQTDFDGKFEFPRTLGVNDKLVFSYIGYGKKVYTVRENESEVIDITITFDLSDIELMGEVVVGGAYKTKRNIFQKFIAIFK